jgi:hypothetical protein
MTTKKHMPKIAIDKLTNLDSADIDLVRGIVNSRTGELRASKPELPDKVKVQSGHYDYVTESDARKGMTAYIWRMVAFEVSPHRQHQCMPICADFDLPDCGGHSERRNLSNRLDEIVKAVVDSVPMNEWHGVIRWGNAFGTIGHQEVTSEGAYIYRGIV